MLRAPSHDTALAAPTVSSRSLMMSSAIALLGKGDAPNRGLAAPNILVQCL